MRQKRTRILAFAGAAVLCTVCYFVLVPSREERSLSRRDEPAPKAVTSAAARVALPPAAKIEDAGKPQEKKKFTRDENSQAVRMLAHVRTWDDLEKAIRQLPEIFARDTPRMRTVFWNDFRQELVSFNGAEGSFRLLRGHLLELPGLLKSISLSDAQAQSLVKKVCLQAIVQDTAASILASIDPERMRSPGLEDYQWTSQIIYAMHSVNGIKSTLENIQSPQYAPWKEVLEAALFRDGAIVDPPATARYFIDQYSASSVEDLRRDARTVFNEWSRIDPEAASSAIDQMTPGSKKDAAIAAMVRAIQSSDKLGAQAWLGQITDVDLRRELSAASEASGKYPQPAVPK